MLLFLKSEVTRLLRILLSRFIKPEVLVEARNDFKSVDLDDRSSVLANENVSIGHKAWMYLSENEDDIDDRIKKSFLKE